MVELRQAFDRAIEDIKSNPVQYLGMFFSVMGSYLTAEKSPAMRCVGFVVWLPANLIVLHGFWKRKNWPMIATFVFYECMNLMGAINNWEMM